ncbi:MAG: S-layer homology domain-containing protein, partial [Clostridia bacterium]|nr:S-layer homology domain-containing protein [Clostridia bacterium]
SEEDMTNIYESFSSYAIIGKRVYNGQNEYYMIEQGNKNGMIDNEQLQKYIHMSNETVNNAIDQNAKDAVTPSEWAAPEVNKALENGLISDETEHFYREYITREEFAELIVTCVNKLTDTKVNIKKNTFTDVNNEAIDKAYSMGIVSGVDDTTFAPKNKITRQEIAAMMHRAIKYVETANSKTYLKNNISLDGYSDSDKVSEWARESVGTLVNNEIIFGTSDTTISPLANTTIEEAVLLDVRIFELMQNE